MIYYMVTMIYMVEKIHSKATDLKMGTDEIKITDAYEYSDHICVEGENFNTFSVGICQ